LGSTWAAYLRAARRAADLTPAGLAKAASVGRATIYRYEAGEARPERVEIVIRIADALGLDLDEALIAAGLRPGAAVARPRRQVPPDPEVALLQRRLSDPATPERDREMIRDFLRAINRRLGDDDRAAAG
jgi:transcriptional regulator with XRE-family HTH domain